MRGFLEGFGGMHHSFNLSCRLVPASSLTFISWRQRRGSLGQPGIPPKAEPPPHPSVLRPWRVPELASSAAMRAFSAYFLGAPAAAPCPRDRLELLALDHVEVFAQEFSAWLEPSVTSRLNAWAAPRGSLSAARSHRKTFFFLFSDWWSGSSLNSPCALAGRPMATILRRGSSTGSWLQNAASLVMFRFTCDRIDCRTKRTEKPEAGKEAPMIRPAERNPGQGRSHHHLISKSRARRTFSRHYSSTGRAGRPRGAARHGAADRNRRYYVMMPNPHYRRRTVRVMELGRCGRPGESARAENGCSDT